MKTGFGTNRFYRRHSAWKEAAAMNALGTPEMGELVKCHNELWDDEDKPISPTEDLFYELGIDIKDL